MAQRKWYYYRVRKPSKHYLKHKEAARALVHARVAHFAQTYGFSYGRIAIRNTKRSWGSCSELGNLNFSYKILFLPEQVADYLIVHELCHLRHFDHSRAYWDEVASILPDYREHQRALRDIRNPVRRYAQEAGLLDPLALVMSDLKTKSIIPLDIKV